MNCNMVNAMWLSMVYSHVIANNNVLYVRQENSCKRWEYKLLS